jgi:hypothetical protein
MTQVRKTYLLHKSLTPGAAKQQNSMIIVKTTIITINVATPWLFVFAVAEDLLDGELIEPEPPAFLCISIGKSSFTCSFSYFSISSPNLKSCGQIPNVWLYLHTCFQLNAFREILSKPLRNQHILPSPTTSEKHFIRTSPSADSNHVQLSFEKVVT